MAALLYTLGSFLLILLLTRVKVPLAAAVLVGAVAAASLFGLSPSQTALAVARGASRPMVIALIVVTVLLLSLSELMRATGQLEEIVRLARMHLRRPAVAMAALPALIGLLPMPGGALFSAPMVESAAGEAEVSRARLSAVNYWFRHVWEHWWPLYPGVIVASTLTGGGLGRFIAYQWPLGVFMAAAGLLIFRGTHPVLHAGSADGAPRTHRGLLRATSSIWVIMVVWGAASAAFWLLPQSVFEGGSPARREVVGTLRRFAPITLGLIVSLLWTVRMNRTPARRLGRILTRRSIYMLAILVVTVMVFQHVLTRVEAAPKIGEELTVLEVPVVAMVVILPFTAGMVTGLAVGFVATSFPIVLGLVEALPGEPSVRAYVALAYACGHLGQMLSPIHVCHVVSNQYFRVGFGPVYRRILPSAGAMAILAAGYFLLLRLLPG